MKIKSSKVQRKCVFKVKWLKIDGCMHPLLKIDGCSCTHYYEGPAMYCLTSTFRLVPKYELRLSNFV